MNRKSSNDLFNKIALKHQTTPEEVHKEICIAIKAGMSSDDPAAQAFWKSIPCKGNVPTPEEVITYFALLRRN